MCRVEYLSCLTLTYHTSQPPNLRTLGIQRVTDAGIDFVVKQGCLSSKDFSAGRPVSILYSQGKYLPGEKAEQWRAEGHAEKIPLSHILEKIPHYTITSMVASKRIAMEQFEGSEVGCFQWRVCFLYEVCSIFLMITSIYVFIHCRNAYA